MFPKFDAQIAEYVLYEESGYVSCSWLQASHRLLMSIYRFALARAEAEADLCRSVENTGMQVQSIHYRLRHLS